MKIAIYSPDGSKGWNIVRMRRSEATRERQPGPFWVWLNERKLDRCIAADDVAGEAWVAALDESGHVRCDPVKQEVILEKVTGKVEIRLQS
jgi:hypothetical protein